MTPEQEQRLREIDRHWEEERGRGISWYVLDVADLRRYLREALEENRFLRQRVEHLENGIMEIARQLGGDNHDRSTGNRRGEYQAKQSGGTNHRAGPYRRKARRAAAPR